MKARHYNDTHQQALNYADADKSDPFTYSRVMSHITNGLCDDNGQEDCRYKAEPSLETRIASNGQSYQVTVYRSLQRP